MPCAAGHRRRNHKGRIIMATVKIIELVGTSSKSWHSAVEEALKEASKTLHGISGLDVINTTAVVKDNKITEYRATLKVAFLVEKK